MKYSQSQADHLQILATSRGTDVPGLGSDIIDDALLQPGNEEMCAFVDDVFLNPGYSIKDDGSSATFHVVYGSLAQRKGETDRDCPFGEDVQRSRHGESFELR